MAFHITAIDDTQLYLSHPDDLTIAARISACLTDILLDEEPSPSTQPS